MGEQDALAQLGGQCGKTEQPQGLHQPASRGCSEKWQQVCTKDKDPACRGWSGLGVAASEAEQSKPDLAPLLSLQMG